MIKPIILAIAMVWITGCSTQHVSPFEDSTTFKALRIEGNIPIKAMVKSTHASQTLLVFIEGDGRAWINRHTPSLDPTPSGPVGWTIASTTDYGDILYLARPCHYLDDEDRRSCTQNDWTSGRFSPKLIELMDNAISSVKKKGGYEKVILGGYSGGGAMAALIALRRSDVAELISVASPIDSNRWCEYHRISTLSASLNPIDEKQKLSLIVQRHFVGTKDVIVPPMLIKEVVASYPEGSPARVIELEGATHKMEGFRIPF